MELFVSSYPFLNMKYIEKISTIFHEIRIYLFLFYISVPL